MGRGWPRAARVGDAGLQAHCPVAPVVRQRAGASSPGTLRSPLHLVRFHGVLAPNAKLRSLVVPQGPEVEERASAAVAASECVVQTETNPDRPPRIGWARLLERVFDIDMQHCTNCGAGELRIIAAILERPVIEKILTHLGLDPQPGASGRWRCAPSRHAPAAARHRTAAAPGNPRSRGHLPACAAGWSRCRARRPASRPRGLTALSHRTAAPPLTAPGARLTRPQGRALWPRRMPVGRRAPRPCGARPSGRGRPPARSASRPGA